MSSQAPNLSRSSTTHEADSHTLFYTASPWKLFWADVATFLRLSPHIFDITMPAWEYSGIPKYDELYPKERGNLFALAMHALLFFVQTFFLISVFVLALIPMWPVTPVVVVGWIWGFTKLNEYLCYPLNGRPGTMQSDPSVLAIQPQTLPPASRRTQSHALNRQGDDLTEKWIFINGVAVGRHWLQSNIDLLSLIFQRPIVGVHNRSAGILFDVIEVLIERTFDYCTTDIRNAFEVLGSSLRDPKTKKVVLLLHSQGGIQGGLIVDWLLDQITREDLGKLEVYTFGCAANHFNNPRVQASATSREPVREAIGHIEHYANIDDFVARWGILNAVHPLAGERKGMLGMLENLVTFSWLRGKKRRTTGQDMKYSAEDEKVGYQGRIFELPRRGHMMNQHYLARMFPLENQNGRWRVREARDGDGSLINMKLKFINQGPEDQEQREERRSVQQGEEIVRLSSEIYPFAPLLLEGRRGHRARGGRGTRAELQMVADNHHIGSPSGRNLVANGENSETTERTPLVVQGLGIDTGVSGLSPGSTEEERDWPEGNLRMKDLSRLWKYVNGGDPDEKLSPVQAKRGKTF